MKTKDIQFLQIRHLRGPNIWTYRPVIEAVVDIGEFEEFPSNTLPGFVQRLNDFLPSLIEHRCSYGERGGFLKRLDEGTWIGHILEHSALELQNLAGMPGGFGKARQTALTGVYKVVIRAWHADISRQALFSARELILAAVNDQPFDVAACVEQLRAMAEEKLLGPSTACIVEAANSKQRRIPALRMLDGGNLVQLGYGAKSRRIWTAETDKTSAIAETISLDKDLTKTLLAACGVPVPEGRLVDNAADAWDAATDIGLPVVVKPYDGNHARGVTTNLTNRPEVEAAYDAALLESSGVIVERFIRGAEHRLLMVGGRLIAAAKGESVSVIGDGLSTLAQLIDAQINSDPRRGEAEEYPLDLVRLNEGSAAWYEMQRQALTADSVLAAGHEIIVVRTGNHTCDVTDKVHPATIASAALATRIVGLDIAGVDLVCEDISQPLAPQNGAIVEVNAGPGLLMHLKPAYGEIRPVGLAIVEHLFPQGDDGRIPVVGVTGSYGKTTVCQLIASLLSLSGKHTGLACSDGLYLDRRQTVKGDCANWPAAHQTLINRTIEAAVFENGSDTILTEGLAYDRCQIGVITNLDEQRHTGRHYIETSAQVANVLRTQIDLVLPNGAAVLNAADPALVELAPLCDGEVIYFALDPTLPALARHLESGKRAVTVRYGQIMLASQQGEIPLAALSDIPLLEEQDPIRQAFQTENILAAVAAAWGLNISQDVMRTGIETFFAAYET